MKPAVEGKNPALGVTTPDRLRPQEHEAGPAPGPRSDRLEGMTPLNANNQPEPGMEDPIEPALFRS